jgi:hypothetical protein
MPEDEQDQKQPASTGDDLRDKFRAALDRKHGRGPDGAAGSGAAGGDPNSKASARTSNSKRQREFRRKSGG